MFLRTRLPFLVLFSISFFRTAPVRAVLVDEIAVTVANQAITQSQIDSEIRLAALQDGERPDLSTASRKKAAERLIEQALIRREMSFGSYPPVSDTDVDQALAATEKARGGLPSLTRNLTAMGLNRGDLRGYIRWQLSLLRFIDLRFRPAVQVTRADVQKYYDDNLRALSGNTGKAPALRDVRAQLEQKLIGERVDEQVNAWIKETRVHTIIHFMDPALGASGAVSPDQINVQPH